MNTYLLVFLGLLLFQAALCTGLKYGWQGTTEGKAWYLVKKDYNAVNESLNFAIIVTTVM